MVRYVKTLLAGIDCVISRHSGVRTTIRDGDVSYVAVSNITDCGCGEIGEEVRGDEKDAEECGVHDEPILYSSEMGEP